MKSKALLSSFGLALIGSAVLVGFVTGGFGHKDFVAHKTGVVAGRSMIGGPVGSSLMGSSAASTLVGAPNVPPRIGSGGMLPIAGNTASPSFRAAAALPATLSMERLSLRGAMGVDTLPMERLSPQAQAAMGVHTQPMERLSPQGAMGVDTQGAMGVDTQTAQLTPTPGNFIPKHMALSEAHWQGMDTTRLTSELRRKLRFPQGLKGIMIDEVTLNAAKSGFLAADVIIQVNNDRVTTLEEFQQSSRRVRNLNQVPLTVLRKGERKQDGRFVITRLVLLLRAEPNLDLGFAQVESAPMIMPGAMRPHPYRGACTNCHNIGKGFELTPDPDGIILPPPAITKATADTGVSPHLPRGPCIACHRFIL